MNELKKLEVHMLGKFTMVYGDMPISFSGRSNTKVMKLLQLLLYHSERGIPRDRLIEELYGREDHVDASNNLRVTVHRMKQQLVDRGLPEYDYVKISKGIYKWQSPMEIELDVQKFTKRIDDAIVEMNPDKKILILKEACALYGGDFLPQNTGESWVLPESLKYKNQYSYAMKELCDHLMEKSRYEEAMDACAPACIMYPLDEWQTVRIRCLIALNRNEEAVKEYEATTKFFFEELGINPPDDMTNIFETMNRNNKGVNNIEEIVHNLRKDINEPGAYYCNYPTFRDVYRICSRISDRTGEQVHLMMCSLTDAKGLPVGENPKGRQMSYELWNTIKKTLRKGDSFTKYAPNQYMIMLIGTQVENCSIVYKRIEKNFTKDHPSWNRYLNYTVIPTTSF